MSSIGGQARFGRWRSPRASARGASVRSRSIEPPTSRYRNDRSAPMVAAVGVAPASRSGREISRVTDATRTAGERPCCGQLSGSGDA